MPCGKSNSKMAPQDSQLQLHIYLFPVSQANTNLGTAEKGCCRSNESPKSTDLKRQRFSEWASPNHVSPATVGLDIRDSNIRESKNEDLICHCRLEDAGVTWPARTVGSR